MKVIGYVFAVVGLIAIAMGSGFFGKVDLIGITSLQVSIVGVALVVIGVVLSLIGARGRSRQKSEEVPIYEGTGKKRRIVGYRKD
jgi:membrane protein implicated in regulation of membrane protease activity